jgi:RNA polymerase sigma factor (TIGR02999 family)
MGAARGMAPRLAPGAAAAESLPFELPGGTAAEEVRRLESSPWGAARTVTTPSVLRRLDDWVPVVYEDLRRMAAAYLRRETPGHAFQPTDLANEAYLRLARAGRARWRDEAHVLGFAARAMRRILIEQARRRVAAKRGGRRRRVPLVDRGEVPRRDPSDVLDLREQLGVLGTTAPRRARIASSRVLDGRSLPHLARAEGVSLTTAEEDWYAARDWLRQRLAADARTRR